MPAGRRGFLPMLETYVDMIINALTFNMAFLFACLANANPPVYPNEPLMIAAMLAIIIFESLTHQTINNYNPTIDYTPGKRTANIFKAKFIALAVIMAVIVLFGVEGERTFLGIWAAVYIALSTAFLVAKRKLIIYVIKALRKGQYTLKRTLIVGDNTASTKEYITQIANNPGCGVMILGYVGDKIDLDVGCDKLGSFKDFIKVLDRYRPTDVVFSIDSYDKRHLIKLVNICEDRCIKVYFLPVIYGFFKDIKQIEQIGTVPIVNAHANPLNTLGNELIKRVMDIFGSIFLIILSSPVMIATAIIIKLTSPGPVFFKQTRVGKMGKTFTMLKFRSMPVDAGSEEEWTTEGDFRPTKFGSFIRRMAIDELPQFFNVLKGDMSLVGPRPEIPRYVEEFRETIPLYMIKHYVKPGVTGLAQVNGLRGDTSVEERIQKDISYIENWSIWLDIIILLKTPFKAFNKYEKYAEDPNGEKERGVLQVIWEKLGFKNPVTTKVVKENQKILYAASTASHLIHFHTPYIEELRREGHTVMTMANGDGVDFNIPFDKKMFSKVNKACRKEIRSIVEKEKFDLIILNTSLAAFHIRHAIKNKGRPRIVNIVHGYLFSETPRTIKESFRAYIFTLAEKLLRRKTDAVLTMNDEDLRIATKQGFALGPIIPVFGMGVPYPVFKENAGAIRRAHSSKGDFVLLFAGELSNRKNQEFLISAMPRLKEKIPKVKLWLLGDGVKKDNLMERAKYLGVEDSVVFLGKKDNPLDYMRDCDLYVSPSKSEGLPFNVVEALGCGKTVLASRIKGHTDILDSGAGILYEPDSKWDFVDKVKDIYEGQITVSEDLIYEGYRNFSDAIVFPDTYDKLKEAAWL